MTNRFGRSLPLAILVLALLAPSGAQAAINQTFEVSIPSVKADGSYTFTLGWKTTTDGGATVAPPVTDVSIRLPAGVEIQKPFLKGRFVCDVAKLKSTRDPNTCKSSQLGTGTMRMDFRPFTADRVPGKVFVFLAKGSQPGAVASLVVLAVPDTSSAFVRDNDVVKNTKPVMQANIFKASGSGYGYRMEMPVEIDAPVLVSVQEFQASMPGLSTKVRGKKKFWVSQPNCHSRKAKFQATFSYVNSPDIPKTAEITRRFKCA